MNRPWRTFTSMRHANHWSITLAKDNSPYFDYIATMIRLMLTGLAAGLFFSTTFILNRSMSLEGGHWFWSASLRYLYMLFFLGAGLGLGKGLSYLGQVCREFFHHWRFYIAAGSIGFGGFYSLICFAADFAPGWVVATTWQLTIIASLIVLSLFGGRFAKRIWFYALVVFSGVALVNGTNMQQVDIPHLLLAVLPVLVAAFCYPLGNQLVWEAQQGRPNLPKLNTDLLHNSFTRVLLLSAGSIPFWLLLYAIIRPPLPSSGQWLSTGMVAFFSGVVATTLFLHARGLADNASKLTAVDATQSSEVLFALAGEIVILHAPPPGIAGIAGIILTLIGLIAFVRHEHG